MSQICSFFCLRKSNNVTQFLLHIRSQSITTSCSWRDQSDNSETITDSLSQLKKDTLRFLERLKDPTKLDTKYIPLHSKKSRAEGFTSKHFKDRAEVQVKAGNGGNGCISLLQVFSNENAGPDGGDGGHGGHVIFKASTQKSSLCHLSRMLKAPHGEPGRNKQMHGANAKHHIIEVPLGTIFKHSDNTVCSLDQENAMYVAARGGAGGKGNMFFASPTEQTPKVAEFGGTGEKFDYEVELRTMADIGLIGFPNAGKSTLLRAVSRARPKVASYAFTTLNPHVGMVHYADRLQLAVADIPGLIEGAHRNRGLGYAFLRHVQRCSGLLYVLDASKPEPWQQLAVLRNELEMYEEGLSLRPHAVVANKIDLPEAEANLSELIERVELPVIGISAKQGEHVGELLSLLRWLTERNAKDQQKQEDYWKTNVYISR